MFRDWWSRITGHLPLGSSAMIVGFLGSGNMAAGLARGWAAVGEGPEGMLFTDSGSGRAGKLAAEVGGEALASREELASRSDLLVIAVKPKDLEAAAFGLEGAPGVLSLLGATPVERVAAMFPESAVMRLMPNLGVEVHRGVLCFAAAEGADEGRVGEVRALLAPLGGVVDLEDRLFDVATAVMACTPAYVAMVAEAISAEGAREGLEPALSASMVTDTVAAAAELLRDRSPSDLIEAVASPGGSTEAGMAALTEGGARESFESAVQASLARMRGEDA
jgi:pyrroline-5-carboxylate reductase